MMARRNWLQTQIRQASADVQQWPEWMKKAAIFDGTHREDNPMQHLVEISNEVMDLVRALTPSGATFKQNGRQLPNGNWEVPIQASTLERIAQCAFPGETISDTILRIAATRNNKLQ